ncbi:PWWP domain-containing DNA repair factor 3A isoform X2 [Spea bombifrons]|uniref:PWWP domain-containing DNA repair factor 3A isoform X2 n=1 Tax=Spea bombifrons TaxID=233779 RepID=UPI00234AF683|nr:PWWP domain-containing DNA repair factor 3A isoform X2 [Spea bombifrons]
MVLLKAASVANDELMDVEILCLDEQIQVKFKDTKLLEKAEVENIAAKLAHKTKSSEATIEELTYRKALRIALDILNQTSALGTSTPPTLGRRDKKCKDTQIEETITSEKKGRPKTPKTTAEQIKTPEKRKCDGKSSKKPKSLCLANNNGDSSEVCKPSRTRDVPLLNDNVQLQEKKRKRTQDSSAHEEEDGAPAGRKSQKANERSEDSVCKNSSIAIQCAVKAECDRKIAHEPAEKGDTEIKPHEERLAIQNSCKEQLCKAHIVNKAISDLKAESCDTGKERVELQQEKRYKLFAMPDFEDDGGLSSSELSLEMSSPETYTSNPTWAEEYPDEDEDLPSLLNQGPSAIKPGMFVWCKYQKYPYWPAVVKCVNQKARRANVFFVEESLSDPKYNAKGFLVSLRTLKLYDCAEKKELLENARKGYGNSIDWCDEVIRDYMIRVGCRSFSGSFTEYCTADISYPVRRELLHCKTDMLFPSLDSAEVAETGGEVTPRKSEQNKKTLPDRTRAARDRANERLVDFIVKTKQAESHLLDILSGKKKSRWLQDFLASNKHTTCIDTYMEDEDQVELVVAYLQTLCEHMDETAQKVVNKDRMRFVLDVLLPEAIIFAISATDEINYKKAEKKYLDGPSISKRERNIFEEQIIEKKKLQELQKQGTKN